MTATQHDSSVLMVTTRNRTAAAAHKLGPTVGDYVSDWHFAIVRYRALKPWIRVGFWGTPEIN
jgi:hypothetical protein